jgi:hypothetical protein
MLDGTWKELARWWACVSGLKEKLQAVWHEYGIHKINLGRIKGTRTESIR